MDSAELETAVNAALGVAAGRMAFDAILVAKLVKRGALRIEDVVEALREQHEVIENLADRGLHYFAREQLEQMHGQLTQRLSADGISLPPLPHSTRPPFGE